MTRDKVCKECVYFSENWNSDFGMCMIELPPWLFNQISEKTVHGAAGCDLHQTEDTEESQ